MARYSFTYDYFFPTEEDGNVSLASVDSRIAETLKLIQSSDDIIVLDDGVQCRTSEDLKTAILNRIKSAKNVPEEKMSIHEDGKQARILAITNTALLAIIAICEILMLIFWAG